MRIILQRVNHAQVTIDGELHSQIDRGYLLLVGIQDSDGKEEIDYLVRKISNLRLFEDENGKMNLSIDKINGSILSVSQFTLYADTRHGNRPSFTKAGKPDYAKKVYDDFNAALVANGNDVKTGVFGADMQVELENDGPDTIIFDTDNK